MKTLDLIRKLYDENADPADLEKGLDPESLAELRAIVEAKNAMDALPARRPSQATLAAVAESARKPGPARPGRMTLLISSRYLPRFAAAAAVAIAVGIGFLTVRSPDLPVNAEGPELAQQMASQERQAMEPDDAPASRGRANRELEESVAETPAAIAGKIAPAEGLTSRSEAAVADRDSEVSDLIARRSDGSKDKGDAFAATKPEEESVDTNITDSRMETDFADNQPAPALDEAAAGGRALMVGAVVGEDGAVTWEDEQVFQTFFWQVQALGQRSPDDEWEEAVPLEGSFRNLDAIEADPNWHEAREEK